MRKTASNFHGMVLAAAGGTAAGVTSLGTITLPAGGPWKIVGAYGMAVPATATAAELCGGHIILSSPSGDIMPNPAPIQIPTGLLGSFLGALHGVSLNPLSITPLELEAAGKAVIELTYSQPDANTVAPQVVAGVLFGSEIIDPLTPIWYDEANVSITAAAATALGTITLSESAEQIVGVCGIIAQENVLTTAEELIGFFALTSDDVKLTPMQLPFSGAFGAGLGATIGNSPFVPPVWIPCAIPVVGGARVDITVDLNTAVTNGARAQVFIAYR
jgi:hypothetical protein